jgi:NitT/TauT family transport system ATP-binding protein
MTQTSPIGEGTVVCRNVRHEYRARGGTVLALDRVSFDVRPGEFVCLVGPTGCGKTTLLKLIAGLAAPTSGQIEFGPRRPGARMRAALVFQEHGLFPWMSVLDNVAFGLEAQGVGRRERRRRAHVFVERVGLGQFAHSLPHELSVGMRQRAGIARAYAADPEVLLMDEPFGSLDAQTRLVLQAELLTLWRDDRKSVVFVTHDIEEAVLLGDLVLVMSGRPGRILERIPVPLPRPRDPLSGDQADVQRIRWKVWKLLESEVRNSSARPAS